MIWFNVKQAYDYLMKNKYVVTLRPKLKREGIHQLFTSLFGKPYFRGVMVYVQPLAYVYDDHLLYYLVEHSGFNTVEEWRKYAENSRYLYYVTIINEGTHVKLKQQNLIIEYSKKFLPEIRQIIKALDHNIRLAIISALVEHKELSFSNLKRLFKISNNELYYHTKELMKAGIIKSYYKEKDDISPYTSYYRLTKLGNSFITTLLKAIIPSKEGEKKIET